MALEYSGGGDPGRTMALLWGIGKKPTRGPKPALSVGADRWARRSRSLTRRAWGLIHAAGRREVWG